MFRELKMSVKRGIALGSITGYLFGIMTLFLFNLNNALLVCSIGILIGLVIGLFINFLYNLFYNKKVLFK